MIDPPAYGDVEVSLFGPGKGECTAMHLGAGRWLIVDSCRDQVTEGGTRPPVALTYLADMSVDVATQVVLIVATHVHDDHFDGIAEIFQACASARFITSHAATSSEFFAAIRADEAVLLGDPRLRQSAYEEYRQVFQLGRDRSTGQAVSVMTRAEQGKVLLDLPQIDATAEQPAVGRVQVTALSPSDEAVIRANAKLAQSWPQQGRQRRVAPVDPNECAIALRVQVGDVSVLLGADLPNGPARCGWLAVLATAGGLKSSLIKVPHHGSPTSDHPGVWTELVNENPVALIAPYRPGTTPRPTKADQQRILALTPHVYQTAKTQTPKPNRDFRRTIDAISSLAKKVTAPWGRPGRVTARHCADPTDDWIVTVEFPAHRVGPGSLAD